MRKRLRKIAVWMGCLALAVVAIVALLPVWLPWVLSPVLESQGGNFKTYHRQGWSRFELQGVTYTNASVSLTIQNLRGVQPIPLLWGRAFRGEWVAPVEPVLTAQDWTLEIHSPPSESAEEQPAEDSIESPGELLDLIAEMSEELRAWIPLATLQNGKVIYEDETVEIPEIKLNPQGVTLQAVDASRKIDVEGAVRFPDRSTIETDIRLSPEPLQTQLALNRADSGWTLGGTIHWLTNEFNLDARFNRESLYPETASLAGKSFSLPAERLGLKEYQDPRGSIAVQYTNRQAQFNLDLHAAALPENTSRFPELNVEVEGSANPETTTLRRLDLTTPMLTAKLSQPLTLETLAAELQNEATLTFASDLSRLPWLSATGTVSGKLLLKRSESRWPNGELAVRGDGIGAFGVNASQLTLEGELRWPEFTLSSMEVSFADQSLVSGNAVFDVDAMEIREGALHAEAHQELLSEWLPEGAAIESAKLESQFHGPIQALEHQGTCQVNGLRMPSLSPWNVEANWNGTGIESLDLASAIQAGDSTLSLKGKGDSRGNLEFSEITLSEDGADRLALSQPAKIVVPFSGASGAFPPVRIEALEFSGESAAAFQLEGSITWPAEGSIQLSGRNLKSEWLDDFLESPLPRVTSDHLQVKAAWKDGPAEWQIDLEGGLDAQPWSTLSARLKAGGDASHATVDELVATYEEKPLLTASGEFPFRLDPASPQILELDKSAPANARVSIDRNPSFWEWLSKESGWRVSDFHGQVDVQGSLAVPTSEFDFAAGELDSSLLNLTTNASLRVSDLRLRGSVKPELFELKQLELKIEDQPVFASATLPIEEAFWQFNSAEMLSNLDPAKAQVEVRIPKTSLAPFARFAPRLMSSSGSLTADVQLQPGFQFGGEVRVSGVSSRPISSIGRFQDSDLGLSLEGRKVIIKQFQTHLGGQPLTLSGYLQGPSAWPPESGLPEFQITIKGQDVPLVRQTGVMVRSDLDLEIVHRTGTTPQVRGTVNLKKSFFLAELDMFRLTQVSTPEMRPPFFSIPTPPFGDFELNVKVTGDEFMQVRTPIFKGVASANLNLDGTLAEPMALGDIRIDSGTVTFPFSNLTVQQGVISLTRENPYDPKLLITASGRSYGFDIQVDVSGTARDPAFAFNSIPPLSSEEILLMITAGNIPRTDFQYSSEQKASKLAFFLGKNLLQKFGADEATEEKLVVRSAEGISTTGKVTYHIEYKLDPRWSLIGEYDEFNAVNAGVKYKIIHR